MVDARTSQRKTAAILGDALRGALAGAAVGGVGYGGYGGIRGYRSYRAAEPYHERMLGARAQDRAHLAQPDRHRLDAQDRQQYLPGAGTAVSREFWPRFRSGAGWGALSGAAINVLRGVLRRRRDDDGDDAGYYYVKTGQASRRRRSRVPAEAQDTDTVVGTGSERARQALRRVGETVRRITAHKEAAAKDLSPRRNASTTAGAHHGQPSRPSNAIMMRDTERVERYSGGQPLHFAKLSQAVRATETLIRQRERCKLATEVAWVTWKLAQMGPAGGAPPMQPQEEPAAPPAPPQPQQQQAPLPTDMKRQEGDPTVRARDFVRQLAQQQQPQQPQGQGPAAVPQHPKVASKDEVSNDLAGDDEIQAVEDIMKPSDQVPVTPQPGQSMVQPPPGQSPITDEQKAQLAENAGAKVAATAGTPDDTEVITAEGDLREVGDVQRDIASGTMDVEPSAEEQIEFAQRQPVEQTKNPYVEDGVETKTADVAQLQPMRQHLLFTPEGQLIARRLPDRRFAFPVEGSGKPAPYEPPIRFVPPDGVPEEGYHGYEIGLRVGQADEIPEGFEAVDPKDALRDFYASMGLARNIHYRQLDRARARAITRYLRRRRREREAREAEEAQHAA